MKCTTFCACGNKGKASEYSTQIGWNKAGKYPAFLAESFNQKDEQLRKSKELIKVEEASLDHSRSGWKN